METRRYPGSILTGPAFCFTRRDDDNDDRGGFFSEGSLLTSSLSAAYPSFGIQYEGDLGYISSWMVLVAPEIIHAIVSPLSSLTSIRIGFGLELSIAEPVRSEVLKRNRIAVTRR